MIEELSTSNIKLQIIPLGNTMTECLSLKNYFSNYFITEVSFDNRSFKSKMKDANKQEIPYVLIVGEDEVKSNLYSLKDMKNSTQYNFSKEECVKFIKNQ